jgi:hypothetical protein
MTQHVVAYIEGCWVCASLDPTYMRKERVA